MVADFPGAWDGIYGVGDPGDYESLVARITECTGIISEKLQIVRTDMARGFWLMEIVLTMLRQFSSLPRKWKLFGFNIQELRVG